MYKWNEQYKLAENISTAMRSRGFDKATACSCWKRDPARLAMHDRQDVRRWRKIDLQAAHMVSERWPPLSAEEKRAYLNTASERCTPPEPNRTTDRRSRFQEAVGS